MTSSASRDVDFQFFRLIKKLLPSCPIVVMGDLAVVSPRETLLQEDSLDGAICNFMDPGIVNGFGDSGLVPVPNLVCKTDGQTIGDGRKTIAQPKIPIPCHNKFPLGRYHAPWGRYKPLLTTTNSDGCPFGCNFCTVGSLEYSARPIDNVIAEISTFSDLGVREVYFQDLLFTASKSRTMKLCEAIHNKAPKLSWCCLSKVNTFEPETLVQMVRTGCHTIQLGLESGDDQILQKMGKGFSVQEARSAVAMCNDAGLRVDAIFMMGYPGETKAQIQKTIETALAMRLHFATFVIVTPTPGTPMTGEVSKLGIGYDPQKAYDDTRNILPLTDLTASQLVRMRDQAELAFYTKPSHWIRLLLSVKTLTEATDLFSTGLRFLWEKLGGR